MVRGGRRRGIREDRKSRKEEEGGKPLMNNGSRAAGRAVCGSCRGQSSEGGRREKKKNVLLAGLAVGSRNR